MIMNNNKINILALSLFVGIIFAIEFSIIRLPMAIVFGLFVGVLNMVPYLQLVSIPIAFAMSLAVMHPLAYWLNDTIVRPIISSAACTTSSSVINSFWG